MSHDYSIDCPEMLKVKALLFECLEKAAHTMPLLTEADRQQWQAIIFKSALDAIESRSDCKNRIKIAIRHEQITTAIAKLEKADRAARLAPIQQASIRRRACKHPSAPICLENNTGVKL